MYSKEYYHGYIFGTQLRKQSEKVKVEEVHKKSKKSRKDDRMKVQRCQKCDRKVENGQSLCGSCMITTI